MSYPKKDWQDLPSQTTPVTADDLDRMENGIANSDGAIGVNEYSTSSTYAIGDYCLHDNKLYRCKTAISTAEAWTSGHWTQVKIVDAIDNTQEDLADATKGFQRSATAEELEITDSAEANGKLNIDSGKTNQISTTGKNILEPYNASSTLNGITCIYDAKEQTYTFNGTCNTDNTYFQFANNEIVFSEGTSSTTFWVSGSVATFCQIRHYDSAFSSNCNYDIVTLSASNPVISRTRAGTSFTSPANRQTIRFNNGSVATNFKIKIMVTNSTSINVYEPFTGGEPAPSPSYPQDIVSIGDNFNLWGGLTNSYTRTSLGVTFTTNTDGTIDANGTATGTTQSTTFSDANTNGLYVELESGTYTVSCQEAITNKEIQIIDESSNVLGTVINTPIIINLAVQQKIILRLSTRSGAVFKNETFHIKLERGMNATSYSPLNRGSIGFKVSNKNIFDIEKTPLTNSSTTRVRPNIKTFLKAGTYTISYSGADQVNINFYGGFDDGTESSSSGWKSGTYTFTTDMDLYFIPIFRKNNDATINASDVKNVQLEKGSTATTYVAHQEQIVTVPMPVGMELCKRNDYIDKPIKINNQWNKNQVINEIILNGTENWVYQSANNRFVLTSATTALSNARNLSLCSHFIYGSTDDNDLRFFITTDNSLLIRYDAMNGDATAFKTWLGQQYSNGNPVKIKYVSSTSINVPITNADTLEGLYQIEHLLMYEGYTLIECIDAMKPDTHVEYLYNNEVNNTFGGIISETNNDIHKLGGYIYEKTGTSSTGCSYSIRYSIIGKVCTAMIDFTLPSNYTLGGIVIDNNILPAPMGYNNVGTPAVLNLRSGTNGEFYKAYLNIYGGISSYKSDVVVNARYQGSISYLVE